MTGMYLEHYGVKGMKWGKKAIKETDTREIASGAVSNAAQQLAGNTERLNKVVQAVEQKQKELKVKAGRKALESLAKKMSATLVESIKYQTLRNSWRVGFSIRQKELKAKKWR